jgi:UDP-N-acetylglucosamine 1-carboxyvinyltransferase
MAQPDRFRVIGGAQLRGEVSVTGAKNSVLKLMAASLLAVGKTTIKNVPEIADVEIMSDLLKRLGCSVEHAGDIVTIDVPENRCIARITTWCARCAHPLTSLVHL